VADTQIRGLGTGSAPLSYTVPGSQEIILKSLFARSTAPVRRRRSTPACGSWRRAAASSASTSPTATVAAGSSAEVTFAPFLRNAAAGGADVDSVDWGKIEQFSSGGFVAVPNNTLTTIGGFFSPGADGTAVSYTSSPAQLYLNSTGVYTATATLAWTQAFAGDRYMTFTATAGIPELLSAPPIIRGAAIPDYDVMTLSATFVVDNSTPVSFLWQAYQNSGVNRSVGAGPGGSSSWLRVFYLGPNTP
jgi:hypothetical protein